MSLQHTKNRQHFGFIHGGRQTSYRTGRDFDEHPRITEYGAHIQAYAVRRFTEGPLYHPLRRGTERATVRGGHGRQRRSEEHTSELQSRGHLVCRLLLEKKKNTQHVS